MNWIKTAERLPEPHQTVLAVHQGLDGIKMMARGGHDWYDPNQETSSCYTPDWWMPLPAMPEGYDEDALQTGFAKGEGWDEAYAARKAEKAKAQRPHGELS